MLLKELRGHRLSAISLAVSALCLVRPAIADETPTSSPSLTPSPTQNPWTSQYYGRYYYRPWGYFGFMAILLLLCPLFCLMRVRRNRRIQATQLAQHDRGQQDSAMLESAYVSNQQPMQMQEQQVYYPPPTQPAPAASIYPAPPYEDGGTGEERAMPSQGQTDEPPKYAYYDQGDGAKPPGQGY